MKQILRDTGEQLLELGQSAKKQFVSDVVKGIPQTAKQQVAGDSSQQPQSEGKMEDKTAKASNKAGVADPITGKPIPSKKALNQLSDAVAKLQMTKLQKIREELDRQRMKVPGDQSKPKTTAESGPDVKIEDKRPDPGAVTRTLKQAQSTGELKGSVGG